MKFGVVIFPGSNCDRDVIDALEKDMDQEVVPLWHKSRDLSMLDSGDCIILPGGFSYGDYLRCGAIARFSPMMQSVVSFAARGGRVLGICNGFQILCEAGLLPGVLLRNANQQFVCKNVYLVSDHTDTDLTRGLEGKVLKIPVAHGEGRYYADADTLDALREGGQVLFRYTDAQGRSGGPYNPNGSLHDIAGICNADKNVFGMMPHPERAVSEALGNTDGRLIFQGLMRSQAVTA